MTDTERAALLALASEFEKDAQSYGVKLARAESMFNQRYFQGKKEEAERCAARLRDLVEEADN